MACWFQRVWFAALAAAILISCSTPGALLTPSSGREMEGVFSTSSIPTDEVTPSPGISIPSPTAFSQSQPTFTQAFHTPSSQSPISPTTALLSPSPPATSATQTLTLIPPPASTRYHIEIAFDYSQHSASVSQTVIFTNTTSTTLASLAMIVEPRRYPNAFQLSRINWEDGLRATQFNWQEALLTLYLPDSLQPGASIQFSLEFTLTLPFTPNMANIRPRPFGYTNNQANFGDWVPFIPPYIEGSGWLNRPSSLYGEYLTYDIADYDVTIRLEGRQTDLTIAASAPAQTEDGAIYHYHHPAARSFAWSASPHYQVITQTVEISPGISTTVASYFMPLYDQAGASVAQTLGQAVTLYSRLFSVYPRPLLSTVQADFLDGMEYDGMFFLSRDFYNWSNGTQQDFLVSLTAHETAHQWWYAIVGNDQALEPWLDEALCTYAEKLYYEFTYPQALDWWWTYRIWHYQPGGPIDIRIYDVPNVTGQYRVYRDSVYLNGALFIEDLRQALGDQAFFSVFQQYLQQSAYQLGSAETFLGLMHAQLDDQLQPLLEKYFKENVIR